MVLARAHLLLSGCPNERDPAKQRRSVLASQEWFGVGKRSFHQIIWRRDVAEFLVTSSPKDFKIEEVNW